jgi:hypothetical protein
MGCGGPIIHRGFFFGNAISLSRSPALEERFSKRDRARQEAVESGLILVLHDGAAAIMIGPFEDNGQCTEFLDWDDVHPDFDGPCDDPRWAVLRLNVSPLPQVMPSPIPPLSEEGVQQWRATLADEDKLLDSLSPGWRRHLSAWPGPPLFRSRRAVH